MESDDQRWSYHQALNKLAPLGPLQLQAVMAPGSWDSRPDCSKKVQWGNQPRVFRLGPRVVEQTTNLGLGSAGVSDMHQPVQE